MIGGYQEPKTQELPMMEGIDPLLAVSPSVHAVAFRRLVAMGANLSWEDANGTRIARVYVNALRETPDMHGRHGLTCVDSGTDPVEVITKVWRQWAAFMEG